MTISFILFLSFFALIGISSTFFSKSTQKDYYLASSSIRPSLVGLSAVATNNSGYMFIGVIGYTYATGLASIWLMIGWILGDFISSGLVHSRLRKATEKSGEISFAGVLANWNGSSGVIVKKVIASLSLLFLLAYASAQLIAGSKALQVLLEWPHWAGASIGAALVLAYCLAGGIRASIWTDAAQSCVMLFAMGTLLFVTISGKGGVTSSWNEMAQVKGFLNLFPKDLVVPGIIGGIIFAVSWAFAGFSVIGQPHIMVRFMVLNKPEQMQRARMWYYLWFTLFYSMATAVGMLSRIYLPDSGSFDPELALPLIALKLMSPFFVGLILAGIFAATMSTADSLILSCSSALTQDLFPTMSKNTRMIKAGTFLITAFALIWALLNKQSVFSMVIMAWSALASAFAPLLVYLCLGKKPSQKSALISIFTGLAVCLLWRYFDLHNALYEGMPGIIAGFAALTLADKVTNQHTLDT